MSDWPPQHVVAAKGREAFDAFMQFYLDMEPGTPCGCGVAMAPDESRDLWVFITAAGRTVALAPDEARNVAAALELMSEPPRTFDVSRLAVGIRRALIDLERLAVRH